MRYSLQTLFWIITCFCVWLGTWLSAKTAGFQEGEHFGREEARKDILGEELIRINIREKNQRQLVETLCKEILDLRAGKQPLTTVVQSNPDLERYRWNRLRAKIRQAQEQPLEQQDP